MMVRRALQQICTFSLMLSFASAYFDLELRYIKQLTDTKFADMTGLKLRKIDGNRKIVGPWVYHVTMNNSVIVHASLLQHTGAGYQLQPFKITKGFCDYHEVDMLDFTKLAASSDFPYPLPCPFPKGTYEVHGFVPSLERFPRVILKTGDYAVEVNYTLGEATLCSYWVGFSILHFDDEYTDS